MSKRKFESSCEEEKKDVKRVLVKPPHLFPPNYTIDNTWVAASKTRNFLMKDPILDWFDHQVSHGNGGGRFRPRDDFLQFIFTQGNEFEKAVMKILYRDFPNSIREISTYQQVRTHLKAIETYEAMVEGVPFIYQGVLHDPELKTVGMPDLLVRSDFLKFFIRDCPYEEKDEMIEAPYISDKYHYVVVDIKFSTLHLKADGKHILNSNSIPAYKSQVYIYNRALGLIQGYTPPCAFLLGKKWEYTKKGEKRRGTSCFDKLGIVNFVNSDKDYANLSVQALDWIRNLWENGHSWTVDPPNRSELYPNMSNNYDSPWHSQKKKVAEKIAEITDVWQCGVKNRHLAHSRDVFRWTDPRCTPETLGIRGPRISPVLQSILNINRQSAVNIYPLTITNNLSGWIEKPKIEFYVDFETVNDVIADFSSLPETKEYNMIFLIGCGWEEPETGIWNFNLFCVDDLTYNDEKKIVGQFNDYIDKIVMKYFPDDPNYEPRIVHWGNIEQSMYSNAFERNHPNNWQLDNWFDLLKLFKKVPIVIRGCLGFGVKEIATKMCDYKMISSDWSDSSCKSGTGAMLEAYKACKTARERKLSMKDLPTVKEIIKYNEVDVKVLWEIISYLRNNHT
jgi:hypothetical protein